MEVKQNIEMMHEKIKRIDDYKKEELSACKDIVKAKAGEIKAQTKDVLKSAIEKIEVLSHDKDESLEKEELFDKITARFNEAYYYSLHRIDDLIKSNDGIDDSLNALKDGLKDLGKGLYQNVKNFAEDDNTKESLKKLKDAAKDIFQKSFK